jgi:hypothetical protein
MRDILRQIGKFCIQGIMWVFILSITWSGKSLYSYAYDVLVDNTLVRTLDVEFAEIWYRLTKTAKVTFAEPIPEEVKM